MNFTLAALQGAFTGCLLTTLVYVLLTSNSLSKWTTSQKSAKESRTHGGSILIQKDTIISKEFYESQEDTSNSVPTKVPTDNISFFFLNQSKRKSFVSVIATPLKHALATIQTLRKTWGRGNEDYLVFIGSGDVFNSQNWSENISSDKNVVEVKECRDFPAMLGHAWTPSQLFCLLEKIHKLLYLQYEWFLITLSSAYISVEQLERFLLTKDLHTITCLVRGGTIILSRVALQGIVPYLDDCLQNATMVSTGSEALNRCFKEKFQVTCYTNAKVEEYFVIYEGSELSPGWVKQYPNFITVYPVHTLRDMEILYQADLLRQLNYHLKKMNDSREVLYTSRICKPQYMMPSVKPHMKMDKQQVWDAFRPNLSYFSNHWEPRDWFDGELKREMQEVSKESFRQLNQMMSGSLTYANIKYGLHRYHGTGGKEYFIYVNTRERITTRLHVLRPFTFRPLVLQDSGLEALDKTIDFVVAVSNVRSRLASFMQTYEDVCLRVEENCRLNLVVYGEKDVNFIRNSIKNYTVKYAKAQINVIPGKGQFSRGRALHIGISTLSNSDLAFACDVDMTIERSFLNRCRRNAIQGRRVYYPEVFKYYNMDYVYKFQQKSNFSYNIDRYHGHWCTYGYGMLCIYKSDYDEIGGYDTTIEGWGGEDIRLVDTVLQRGYDVMRAPDPALSHRYHPKVCSKKLTKDQYLQCLSSRNEDVADNRRLVDYIQYLEKSCKVNIKGSRKI